MADGAFRSWVLWEAAAPQERRGRERWELVSTQNTLELSSAPPPCKLWEIEEKGGRGS